MEKKNTNSPATKKRTGTIEKKRTESAKAKSNSRKGIIIGTVAGAAVGAAAGLLLATETGKELRGDIKKRTEEFYDYLMPELKKMKKAGEAEFKTWVKAAAEAYGRTKKITAEEQKILVAEAEKSWKRLKERVS